MMTYEPPNLESIENGMLPLGHSATTDFKMICQLADKLKQLNADTIDALVVGVLLRLVEDQSGDSLINDSCSPPVLNFIDDRCALPLAIEEQPAPKHRRPA